MKFLNKFRGFITKETCVFYKEKCSLNLSNYSEFIDYYNECGITFPINKKTGVHDRVHFKYSLTKTAQMLSRAPHTSWMAFDYLSASPDHSFDQLVNLTRDYYLLSVQRETIIPHGFKTRYSDQLGQDFIYREIERLTKELDKLGFRPQIGTEMEFGLDMFPVGYPHRGHSDEWKKRKKIFLKAMKNDPRRHDARQFNARETLLLEMHEHTPELAGKLEHKFGPRSSTGYYDAANVLEIQTIYSSPPEQSKTRKKVLEILLRLADAYQLHTTPAGYHNNFSFVDKDGNNIFDPQSPTYHTHGQYALAGMAKAFSDIPTLVARDKSEGKALRYMGINTSRITFLRISPHRLEVRTNGFETFDFKSTNQEPDLVIVAALAGALYGLKHAKLDPNVEKLYLVRKPFCHYKNQLKLVAHVLNGSTVTEDGHVECNHNYLEGALIRIAQELDLIPPMPEACHPMQLIKQYDDVPQQTKDYIRTLFAQVKITKDRKIIWPKYADHPRHSECLKALNEGVTCHDIQPAYVNRTGYDLNDFSNIREDCRIDECKASRHKKLKKSKLFSSTLSAPFRKKLASTIAPKKPCRVHTKMLKEVYQKFSEKQWDQFFEKSCRQIVDLPFNLDEMTAINNEVNFLFSRKNSSRSPLSLINNPEKEGNYFFFANVSDVKKIMDVLKNPREAYRKHNRVRSQPLHPKHSCARLA